MTRVIAKIKQSPQDPYRMLLSTGALYDDIVTSSLSTALYRADYNLDEEQWFKVPNFTAQEFCPNILKNKIDTKNYNSIKKEEFGNISCLLSLQGRDVYFQKVTPSSFITRKFIKFGEVARLEKTASRIIVKTTPDAVYIFDDDYLIFKNISTISSIFKGIDQLYKTATSEEVKEFLRSPFIALTNGFNHTSVSKPNRKRLSLVLDTLGTMPVAQRANLVDYIREYCEGDVSISDDGQTFEVATDNQLKLILYGIEERFYTTQHSLQKRLANSIEALP